MFLFPQAKQIDCVYAAKEGAEGLLPALKKICQQAADAAKKDYKLIILSDRIAGPEWIPVGWGRIVRFFFLF